MAHLPQHPSRCISKQTRRPKEKASSGKQRGATLIEFVIIVPILVGILFAIVEFGWTFYQVLDTRHVAREGARLVAVNYSPNDNTGADQRDDLIAEICLRIEDPGVSRVSLEFIDAAKTDVGDMAVIRVERDLEQLTNFYNEFLKDVTPNSEVTFRLEREAGWAPTTSLTPCP